MFAEPDYRRWRLSDQAKTFTVVIWEPTTGAGRRRGLLDCQQLASDQGLLLVGAPIIHMIGMNFAIDICFIDRHSRIVSCRSAHPGWRLYGSRGWRCLELAAGAVERFGLAGGQQLCMEPFPLVPERDPLD
jgi:uncharacterized membrane protein (UPF0127 family)